MVLEGSWCFTEKDSAAVVGQPTPTIKLLKIGSWGKRVVGGEGSRKSTSAQWQIVRGAVHA